MFQGIRVAGTPHLMPPQGLASFSDISS